MSSRFEELYCGYHLRFGPQLTHDGRYLAFVIVSHASQPMYLEVATTLDTPSFPTELSAACAGRMAAISWVDNHLPGRVVRKSYRQRVLEQSDREISRRIAVA